MIAVSSERQILSILLGYTYNESGYGRDAKKDYWALLKKAGIQLYDNSATKTFAAAKIKEQMLLLESVGAAIQNSMDQYEAQKKQ